MKTAPLFAVAAGICAACFLPLPEPPVAAESLARNKPAKAPAVPERRKARSSAEPEEAAPVPDMTVIEHMDRAERVAALDGLLKEFMPDPARLAVAVSLAASLFREPAGHDFPGSRQLPSWLLVPVCQAAMKDAEGLPAALSGCLPSQRHGKTAAFISSRELGKTADAASARNFLRSMPAEWRANLSGSLRHGLAAARPREALAGILPESDKLSLLMETVAREGPCPEALEVLLERRADLSDYAFGDALRSLFSRDAEETRRQIAALGDESLTRTLAGISEKDEAAPQPQPVDDRSLPELLADPAAQSRAGEALALAAVQSPDAAFKAWSEMEEGPAKIAFQSHLLSTLAYQDPEAVFAFAQDLPVAMSGRCLGGWLAVDAPAALKAVLGLPFENELRQKLVDVMRGGWSDRILVGDLSRQDLLIAAQELPPELLKEVTRGQ